MLTGLFGRGDWRDLLQTFAFPLVAMMVLSAVLLTITLFLFSQVFQIFVAEVCLEKSLLDAYGYLIVILFFFLLSNLNNFRKII